MVIGHRSRSYGSRSHSSSLTKITMHNTHDVVTVFRVIIIINSSRSPSQPTQTVFGLSNWLLQSYRGTIHAATPVCRVQQPLLGHKFLLCKRAYSVDLNISQTPDLSFRTQFSPPELGKREVFLVKKEYNSKSLYPVSP